jgi:crotonobetainyl-CoA:carnitine CoA-transferase CaiB-like acyl-CoA transferase
MKQARHAQQFRRDPMASDNVFSGLKVVDFSSFVAAPGAAVILSDFGADVIKVEPPTGDPWRHGHQVPPQPLAEDPYQWHLANRNKRSITLDLKSPSAQQVLQRLVTWADVFIVNTPHHARKKLKLEFDDVAQWNPRLIYADLTGFGENGPDANLPGFDLTSYWARSGLLSLTRDAGVPPTWPVGGSGDNATAVGSIRRSSRRSIAASAPARDRTSPPRCSPRVSGRRAFRSRARWSARSLQPRMIARTPRMRP